MSHADDWTWDGAQTKRPRARPRETLDYLRAGAPFAIVRSCHLAVTFVLRPSGQPLLSASLLKVFLCLLSYVNWDPEAQGGYPVCWPGTKAISRETGLSENTVTKHLAALSDGPYIERSRAGEVRHRGLGIIRRADPDEAAYVRDELGVAGRPPIVWILCHPQDWTLPAFAREQFEARLQRLRSRGAPQRRAARPGRRNGGRSTEAPHNGSDGDAA